MEKLNWLQNPRCLARLERLRLASLPRRLEILCVLEAAGKPLRVSQITEACPGRIQPEISQQLRILRDAGILEAERRGTSVFYEIVDQDLVHLLRTLQTCWIQHQPTPAEAGA